MTTTLLEIVKLMEIFDMKIVEIKFVEIFSDGKSVEIKIRRNKMIYNRPFIQKHVRFVYILRKV